MKFLIITKRRASALPVETMEPARNWIKARLADKTLDCCYGFLNGGGISIMNAKSHEDLVKLLMDYPESRWVDFDIHGLCDIDMLFDHAEKLAVERGTKKP